MDDSSREFREAMINDLRSSLLPLVNKDVRQAFRAADGSVASTNFGVFRGSSDDTREREQSQLTLIVGDVDLVLDLAKIAALNTSEWVIDDQWLSSVTVKLEDGSSIELEPDLITLSTEL